MKLLIFLNFLSVILSSYCSCFVLSYNNNNIVEIECKLGKLRGLITNTQFNQTYFKFTSVPYAEPPLGSYRFRASKLLKKWNSTIDATKPSPMCSQINEATGQAEGQEDCLYLNIATSNTKFSKKLLPVMVWIHGGGFKDGSGSFESYSPDYLLSENVVFVSINYRLNSFGFLSIEDSDLGIPGNAGLKDQVLALRWIKENIKYFGGDPNLITIFGESSGGASTSLLLFSPMAKGLFNRVISQSGAAACPWLFAPRQYDKLLELLNCNHFDNKYDKFKCLNSKTIEEILRVEGSLVKPEENLLGSVTQLGVVYELPSNEEAFITEPVEKLVKEGKFSHVPVLNGYNTHEGALMQYVHTRVYLNLNDTELLIPDDLNLKRGTNVSKSLGEKIKKFYWGKTELVKDNLEAYIKFHTDTAFLYTIYKLSRLLSKKNTSPVYLYNFNNHHILNSTNSNATEQYVSHTFELPYLFYKDYTNYTQIPLSVKKMVRMWTDFARYGTLDLVDSKTILNETIYPIQDQNILSYFRIDKKIEALVNPEHERMQFWDSIYEEYNNRTH